MTPENIREEGDRLIKIFKPLCSGNSQTDINDKLAAKAAIKAVEEIIKALPSISCEYEIENVYKPILNYLKSKS